MLALSPGERVPEVRGRVRGRFVSGGFPWSGEGQGQAGLEKGGISVELELFLFTSKSVTNIWAGIGAGKWAISETSPADMQSRHHKIQRLRQCGNRGRGPQATYWLRRAAERLLPTTYCRLL